MATLLQLESTPEITNLMIGSGDAESSAPRRGRSQVQAGGRKVQDRAMPRAQSKRRIASARGRRGNVGEEPLLAITYEPEKGAGAVTQPCVPSPVPAAGADPGAFLTEIASFFESYQSSAEDASTLMLQGGGTLLSVMSSKQTQKMAVYLMNRAVERIVMTAFTFDLIVIRDALIRAATRKIEVLLFVDRNQALSGSTQFMVERMKELR